MLYKMFTQKLLQDHSDSDGVLHVLCHCCDAIKGLYLHKDFQCLHIFFFLHHTHLHLISTFIKDCTYTQQAHIRAWSLHCRLFRLLLFPMDMLTWLFSSSCFIVCSPLSAPWLFFITCLLHGWFTVYTIKLLFIHFATISK